MYTDCKCISGNPPTYEQNFNSRMYTDCKGME